MKKIYIYTLTLLTLFASCKPDLEVAQLSAGDADFTKYVSIGNSLTAGYSDGALYEKGQMNSYPTMISKQLNEVGGASVFNLPITSLNGSDGGATGAPGRRILAVLPVSDCAGVITGKAVGVTAYTNDDVSTNIYTTGGFQNMGVPGIKVAYTQVPSAAFPNLFFNRIASTPAATYMSDVMAQAPTFFTFWLGNNDVLGYATSGGSGAIGGFGPADITDANVFEANVVSFLDTLRDIGAQGIIANIPDVTSVPFFTTIPANGLPISRQTQADSLNGFWAFAGGIYSPTTALPFQVGSNYFVIEDSAVATNRRALLPGELLILTLPQANLKCAGWGSTVPIPAKYVLDLKEIKTIDSITTIYNNILKTQATAHDFGFVDMNNFLSSFGAGIVYDGVSMDSRFVQGGIFSLDGVHPTAKGYALAANEFIKSINAKYSSILPFVEVNDYEGVLFP